MTTEKTRTYAKLDLKSGAPKVYASSVDRIVCNFFRVPNYDKEHTAGVTDQQGMLITP